jgi:FkbM family methyltransferase
MPQMHSKLHFKVRDLIKTFLMPVTKNYIYKIKFDDKKIILKGGLGFFRPNFNKGERFISNLDLRGKTIYDLGSHIGIFTIFFAKSSGKKGKVIAFEPNPECYIKTQTNVELNELENVEILNIGIGDKRETKPLFIHHRDDLRGTMKKDFFSLIQKEKGSKGSRSFQVKVDTLDDCIKENNLPKPDFIKMDIEGMEYNALLGMAGTIKKYKPSIHIEVFSALEENKIKHARRIVKFLSSYGYSIYHIETKQMVTNKNAQIAKGGHIFCK